MTEQEFDAAMARGHETHGLELKGPGTPTDAHFLARVVRAILGMANRRGGGLVIIGVEDANLNPVGFGLDEVKPWRDYDVVAGKVNAYASPSVNFEVEIPEFRGRFFVIIRVSEFDDIPVLCKKDSQDKSAGIILRRGACYVRSHHKPETAEIPTIDEMRELLELATDKGVQKFIRRAQEAGILPSFPMGLTQPSDERAFGQQIEDMR